MAKPANDRFQEGCEHLMEVRRTARYHTFGAPDGPWDELWYVLHGYAQLAGRFGRTCSGLATEERLIVAPEGLSRFYGAGTEGSVAASWMTSDLRDKEIADSMGFLAQLDEHIRPPARSDAAVTLLGFSQGGAAAARFAILTPLQPKRLILWGAGFPPDLDKELSRSRLADVEVVLVMGRSDPYIDEERIEIEFSRLKEVAPHARLERFEGGHRMQRQLLRELA